MCSQNMHLSVLALQALQTILHDAGVIYPITDSKWVAPILLVPKKTRTMLEEIQNDAYENARICKEKTKSLHNRMITRKDFNVGDKVLYHSRLKLFPRKLCSRWIRPFVVSNVFPYSAVKITSLVTNKILKVKGHRLKPFYEGWMTELTASIELAEPIYEEWACNMSSQWHKTKALTRRQSSKKKKIQICFLFPYLLFFSFYFIFFILLYSCSFISTLRTMLCFKCGGIGRMLVFLF